MYFFVFSTFCLVDKQGTCVAVTVFNLAEGKGVIIGDSVAIPEPFVTDIDFTYKEHVSKTTVSCFIRYISQITACL